MLLLVILSLHHFWRQAKDPKHMVYLKLFMKVLDLISQGGVKGIAHITGGGFTDNIPRVFPEGLGAVINTNSRTVPPVFRWIQEVTIFV